MGVNGRSIISRRILSPAFRRPATSASYNICDIGVDIYWLELFRRGVRGSRSLVAGGTAPHVFLGISKRRRHLLEASVEYRVKREDAAKARNARVFSGDRRVLGWCAFASEHIGCWRLYCRGMFVPAVFLAMARRAASGKAISTRPSAEGQR
jgi:hypothetical protein